MKYRLAITIVFCLIHLKYANGQKSLLLEKVQRPSKRKYLDLERRYDIITSSNKYLGKKIVDYTDSTISIIKETIIAKDTANIYSYAYRRIDTLNILMSDISIMKNAWFESRGCLMPFGYFAVLAAVSVIFYPVAAIANGRKGVEELATAQASIISITAPVIFLGTRNRKYDLVNKWRLRVE